LVPINPQDSPFFTSRLTSFNAKNSWNISSPFSILITYSFKPLYCSVALLKRTVALVTLITVSLFIRYIK
jgi:hypothetical protein